MPHSPFSLAAALAASLLTFAALPPAAANAQASASFVEPLTLTSQQVEGFIVLTPQLRELSKRYGGDAGGDLASNALTATARSQQAMADLNALLKQHGFNDVAEWGVVASNIAMAYNWISEGEDPEQALEQQIAGIEAEPALSNEQKAQMLAMLESQRQVVREMKPPAGNIAIVTQYRGRIATALEE